MDGREKNLMLMSIFASKYVICVQLVTLACLVPSPLLEHDIDICSGLEGGVAKRVLLACPVWLHSAHCHDHLATKC